MPLWIFENETLRAMLADADNVWQRNSDRDNREVCDEAACMISAIKAELKSRLINL